MGLFEKAIKYATEKHSGSYRKGTRIPYITHPIETASIVSTLFDDGMSDIEKDEILAAAVLHDTIEDTDATVGEIIKKFGEQVARLVLADSEKKRRELPVEETWKVRKQETIDYVEHKATRFEKMVVLGDKLSNIRAIARDYEALHDKIWKRFNVKDPEEHAWYYCSFMRVLFSEFKDKAAYKEYVTLAKRVFGDTKIFKEIYRHLREAGYRALSQKDFLKRISRQFERDGAACWLSYGKEVPLLNISYVNWDRKVTSNIVFGDKDDDDEVGIVVDGIGYCPERDRFKLLELFNVVNRTNNYRFFIDYNNEIRMLYHYKIDSSLGAGVTNAKFFTIAALNALIDVMPKILEIITVG